MRRRRSGVAAAGTWFWFLAAVFACLGAGGEVLWASAPLYTIQKIDPLNGGEATYAYSINNLGQVVVQEMRAYVIQNAFLFQNGAAQALPLREAVSINDAGVIAGRANIDYVPYVVYDHGAMTIIGAGKEPGKINASGQVVGWMNNGDDGYLFSQGTLTSLHGIVGDRSRALSINDNGVIVGFANTPLSSSWRAFKYDHGAVTYYLNGEHTFANDINNNGQMAGKNLLNSMYRPVMWNGDQMIELPRLPGCDYGEAAAINDLAQVVGNCYDQQNNRRAFLNESGVTYDLMGLVPDHVGWRSLSYAMDINNSGQIVGYGLTDDWTTRAFVLTPVPEPATLGLLAVGGLGLLRRRIQRN